MSERYGISQPVRRREDLRLLTGRGTFADDCNETGQAYASFVRSPVAHGKQHAAALPVASGAIARVLNN